VAQWWVTCKKDQLKQTLQKYRSDQIYVPTTEATSWITTVVAQMP
jgi:hypothetical protein